MTNSYRKILTLSKVWATAKWDETLTDKRSLLFYCKNAPKVMLRTPYKSWEKQTWKFQFCYPSFFFLSFSTSSSLITENHRAYMYMDALHVKQLLYYMYMYCRCVFSGLELHVRHEWQATCTTQNVHYRYTFLLTIMCTLNITMSIMFQHCNA